MYSKPILMIHNITDTIFNLQLEDYVLTFDDGTHDHYEYFEKFKLVNTQKYYFIIADYVGTEGYLNLNEIKEMMMDPLVTIGGHSFSHTRLENYSRVVDRIAHIKQDTKLILEWFDKNLGFKPTKFCFPYNNDLNGIYSGILNIFNINELYGRERIPVEMLQHN